MSCHWEALLFSGEEQRRWEVERKIDRERHLMDDSVQTTGHSPDSRQGALESSYIGLYQISIRYGLHFQTVFFLLSFLLSILSTFLRRYSFFSHQLQYIKPFLCPCVTLSNTASFIFIHLAFFFQLYSPLFSSSRLLGHLHWFTVDH